MGRRHRERAKVRRIELIKRLGGRCRNCGTKGSDKNPLHIDHIHGRDYDLTKMDQSWRIAVYEREEKEGKIQVLCRECNGYKQ